MAASDSFQRNRALQPGSSCIVQAPAGSGKTELLTQRFLRLLSEVDQPERVLAITFTRKATQEMRERIMQRLRQAGQGVRPAQEHEQLAVGFATRALARSASLGWDLLDNPGRLQIQTIDGLCARISGRALRPGDGASGLLVLEDARPLYEKAARRLIEDASQADVDASLYAALSRALVFLKGNATMLQDMLATMLGRRDQWLRRLGVRHEDMRFVLSVQQQVELQALAEILGAEQLDSVTAGLREMARVTTDEQNATALLDALQASAADPEDTSLAVVAAWRVLKTVATAANEPYAARSVKSRVLPARPESPAHARDAVCAVLAGWKESEESLLAFNRFLSSPPLPDADDGEAVLEDFQLLLKFAAAQLRVLFTEAGQTDFIHIADLALQALGDDLAPGDALLAEDGSLQHILLDEFQDTSFTQYELVKRLVSGWQAGDGRSLFLVGDPMQSIYRFRKADVSLFNRIFERGTLGPVALESLRLTSNFRSRAELIAWVNQQFPRVFSRPAYPAPNFVGYTAVAAELAGGGQVVAHPFPENAGAHAEAGLIAELVVESAARSPEMTIAVLGRARAHLEPVAAALRKRKHPFEAVQVEALNGRPIISDLLMILRAILHPADRIAWLALLRAPWCALNADELLTVAGPTSDDEMLSRIGNAELLDLLPAAKRARVLSLHQILSAAIEASAVTPLSRLVEVSWLRLNGPYAAGSREELDNASQFLKLLRAVEEERPEDLLSTITERLENFYSGSREARVKLMTIHKAKGLEFDMVILPGLHRSRPNPDLPLLRIQDIPVEDDLGVLMAARKRKDGDSPGLYGYLGRLESEQQDFESCRVLYVAVTRAKSELHLFGGWKWSKTQQRPVCARGTFMEMLWPFFEPGIDAEEAPEPVDTVPVDEPPLLPQLYLDNEPGLAVTIAAREPVNAYPELRIPDPDSIALGKAFHLWMQLIHDHWSPQWNAQWFQQHPAALAASLTTAGASAKNLEGLVEKLTGMIEHALTDDSRLAMISPEGKTGSWAELGFVSRQGVHLRRNFIDRLYLDQSDEFVLVDYKTGAGSEDSQAKWDKQLEQYAELVKARTGKDVKEAGIYVAEFTK